jgi:hypothetical protein
VADRRGIGFGWLQNAWLLDAHLNILTRGLAPGSEPTQKTRGPVHWLRSSRASAKPALTLAMLQRGPESCTCHQAHDDRVAKAKARRRRGVSLRRRRRKRPKRVDGYGEHDQVCPYANKLGRQGKKKGGVLTGRPDILKFLIHCWGLVACGRQVAHDTQLDRGVVSDRRYRWNCVGRSNSASCVD